ncbi:MAG: Outer-membrane lipoprotein carrier protein [Alphaproteobacteria bacterium MarineAlpha3_Bin5]|nr:hypothetical protein [Magnetovibrio sp.]PPR80194.1 MAG: Outer-membrane lipoprotein carrier protein [Alphaproteobacteria bacterium MarineAlpha3_Bin5]
MRSLRFIIRVFLFLCSALSPAIGDQNLIELSQENKPILEAVEKYLNSISTLEAKFIQVSSNGDHYEGTLKLSRPGNLRIDYKPPYPVVILADHSYLTYFDTKLRQVSNIDINQTPLSILLEKQFSFSNSGVSLEKFKHQNGVIQVSVAQTNNPQNGKLTLIFSDTPIELRKWAILDSRDITTNVALVETTFGGHIAKEEFIFELPILDNTR